MSEFLGCLALSRAGRDKGRYSVVVGTYDNNHILLADGRGRKTDSPKKKKLKHISIFTDKKLETAKLTNRQIREFIAGLLTEEI